MWTPAVTVTPRQMTSQVARAMGDLGCAIQDLHREPDDPTTYAHGDLYTELLIVDEADRLKTGVCPSLRTVAH